MARKKPKDEIGPFKKIAKLIRSLTPKQIREIADESESSFTPTKALPISKVFEITDPNKFFIELHSHLSAKVEASPDGSWDALHPSERAVAAVYELESEVNNGGFDQYFFNSAGDHAGEAVSGFTRIGAVKMADIVRRALEAYPGGKPSPDRETRWKQTDKIEKKAGPVWSALFSEFLKYPENPAELVFRYCHEHRGDFGA